MPTGSNSVLPQQVSDVHLGDTVIQLSCGSFHSLLLTSAGEVFSWGSNSNGQLGQPQTSELVRPRHLFLVHFSVSSHLYVPLIFVLLQTQPKKVHCSFNGQKIATIAAGDEFSLVVDERGIPWTWGRTDRGQVRDHTHTCLLYTSPSPRDATLSRMPSSA